MITRHPADETLLASAAGRLAPSLRIVIDSHVERCAACARAVARFEALGGVLLEQIEPVALTADAYARSLGRIEASELLRSRRPAGRKPSLPAGAAWPASMRDCSATSWRWLAPGMRWSRVTLPHDAATNVFLLRIGAGQALPRHSHTGREFTHVIHGEFSDGRGHYAPGDFDETDDDIHHQPVVEPGGECICLAGVDGRIVFEGLIARLFSSMVGI